jgi:branched-chain amino acid transport system ATP-binding protein
MPMLEVKDLNVSYGAIKALEDVSLSINEGEIVSLLGANGAGKTSLLNAVSRIVKIAGGSIEFDGFNLNNMRPETVVNKGIAHCPEGRRIFPDLTVMENLDMGAFVLNDKTKIKENLERAFSYFPVLAERRTQKGGTLSGGEQQMLALARALMSSPRLLMLDEPSLGLAPMIIAQIFGIITRINKEDNVTIFLIEQNANEALLHSNRAYVLENGRISISGKADELRQDPKIKAAYLGGEVGQV